MLRFCFVPLALVLLLAGCVGTDFVDDPIITVPARIEASGSASALLPGETAQLSATYYDELGEAVPETAFTWETSDAAVVAVRAGGVAAGVAVGTANLVAVAHDVSSDPVAITVVADANQVATVEVGPAAPSMQVDDTHRFRATAHNLAGGEVANAAFTWASGDPTIASVDAAGLVTAHAPGSTTITATADGVASPGAPVEVLGAQRSGTFQPKPGSGYNVEGTATLRQTPTGSPVLDLESDFSSSAGPSLGVYLSNSTGVDGTSLKVSDLDQVTGPLSFPVTGATLTQYQYVVIHCIPFNVTFGWATLQ